MSPIEPITRKTRLGLVGLGIMGAPIALRLREAGYRLTVWNLEPERYDLVRDGGAEWADSPAGVWADSDVVLTCILGDDALESVCFGPSGFATARDGARLLVDLSTSSPEATLRLAPRLAERAGAAWIDAPMSGGPQPARSGDLTLMVGADEADFEAAGALFSDIGANVTRMGPLGAGQKAKILNQAIVGVGYVMAAELLALARKAEIDPELLRNCLKGGLADSAILQRIFAQMIAEDFDPPRSYARQIDKDLKSVSRFVAALGLDLPLIEKSVERYHRYVAQGNEMADGASVSRLYQK